MKKRPVNISPQDWEEVEVPELDREWFRNARPAREVLPEILDKEQAEELLCSRPKPLKTRVTLTLDADLLEWLKQQGPGYQHRINRILRQAMLAGRENL